MNKHGILDPLPKTSNTVISRPAKGNNTVIIDGDVFI